MEKTLNNFMKSTGYIYDPDEIKEWESSDESSTIVNSIYSYFNQ